MQRRSNAKCSKWRILNIFGVYKNPFMAIIIVMKRVYFLLFLICFCFIFSGCELTKRQPLTVTFIDISGAMSTDHTIKISFTEEKEYEEYYIDILVKANKNTQLTLYREFASKEEKITLNVGENYVSLDEYNLFNLKQEHNDSMVGYGNVLATNLVINSSENAKVTFIAVIGEKKDGNFNQIAAVSNEYNLQVLKHKW